MLTQREYQRKLTHAQTMIEKRITNMKRTLTSLTMWQRRANYYARQAALTDSERATVVAGQKQRREEIKRRRAGRRVVL